MSAIVSDHKPFMIDSVYMITLINDDGTEGIAGHLTMDGGVAPFFVESDKKLPSLEQLAQMLANAQGYAKIVKFSGREEVKQFSRERKDS